MVGNPVSFLNSLQRRCGRYQPYPWFTSLLQRFTCISNYPVQDDDPTFYNRFNDPPLRTGSKPLSSCSMSRRGNARIRKLLYYPTLTGIRHNSVLRGYYERLPGRDKEKMVAVVACMRKMPHIIVGVLKYRAVFVPNRKQNYLISTQHLREGSRNPSKNPGKSRSCRFIEVWQMVPHNILLIDWRIFSLETTRKVGFPGEVAVDMAGNVPAFTYSPNNNCRTSPGVPGSEDSLKVSLQGLIGFD